MTPDPLAARVHALIAQWREDAAGMQERQYNQLAYQFGASIRTQDADALEAALAAAPQEELVAELNIVGQSPVSMASGAMVTHAVGFTEAVLLRRYLQNHCENADREGMSVLCECKLCIETRAALAAALAPKPEEAEPSNLAPWSHTLHDRECAVTKIVGWCAPSDAEAMHVADNCTCGLTAAALAPHPARNEDIEHLVEQEDK